MNPRHLLLIWCIFAVALTLQAQIKTEKDLQRAAQGKTVKPEERVSFKADLPYPRAIEGLSEVTKKLYNKEIVDNSPIAAKEGTKIDENIEGLYWKDALELILRKQGLWYLELQDKIVINTMDNISKIASAAQTQTQPTQQATVPTGMQAGAKAVVDSAEVYARMREVTLSAIFLEINQTKLREAGISLSFFRGADMSLNVEILGANKVNFVPTTAGLVADAASAPGKLAVDVESAVKIFESEQFGEVISRPQVTVREGSTGRVQIGEDFSIRSRDFQGNTIETFYPTGTILNVTPRVYRVGKLEFIAVQLQVERSTVNVGNVSTIVSKTQGTSTLSLLNGEESYLGGLYVNEYTDIREGVPFLKDLPWWFFGLRYIFGYDAKREARKELIVIMKAELVPLLEERAAQRVMRDVQQDRLRDNQRDIDKRQGKR